jgi:general secretion pathway protein B
MSFILDALRKSEHERQRNKAPGIAAMRGSGKSRGPNYWIPLVALLVGINVALLTLLWLLGDSSDSDTVAAASLPAALVVKQPNRPEPLPLTTQRPRNLLSALPEPAVTHSTTAFTQPAAPARRADNRVPTMIELVLDGSLNIMPLHLDIHVYSQNPQERFVFINTTRYREGDLLDEGPAIKEINEEGVILNYQGRAFAITRE